MLKGSLLLISKNKTATEQKLTEILAELKINSKANLDMLIIERYEDKKNIGIDQIKAGRMFLSKKPFQGKNKALIIQEAGGMTIEAQNALLKILEEPPSYATIILCVRNEEDVLSTIISRCQRIFVHSVVDRVGEWAGTNNGGQTSYGRVSQMSGGGKLAWAEETSKEDRNNVNELLEQWIIDARKLLETQLDNQDENQLSIKALHENIILTVQTKADLEKTNVNMRLALENLVLHMQ